jgi:CheY-like chemotaxis protein/two-component sensor histidine kinase
MPAPMGTLPFGHRIGAAARLEDPAVNMQTRSATRAGRMAKRSTMEVRRGASSAGERATFAWLDDQDRKPGPKEALHDVSNALTVVLGWLDEACRDGLSPDDVRRAIGVATRKAREARVLAREAIGASPIHEVARPIGEIVTESIDALAIEAARAGVTITIDNDGQAPVLGAAALGHIITNLVLNAIAFSPAGSNIRVALASDAAKVSVTISDEGPGVDPTVADMLFEGRTSRPGGAGIGLRHAREMTRRLGGELTHVDAGRGATFALELPRHVPSGNSEAPKRPSSSATMRSAINGLRVLLVEDDRAVCALLDAGLGARGAEVIAVHDRAALRAALPGIGSIDAVLLDLSPIQGDVQGSIDELRRACPAAGIVFISGSAVALEAELTAGDPRARWVRKPFEVSEITQAIAELLPRR